MTLPIIQHHGAASGVTGSCHRYQASDSLHVLIDCGLFQGQEALVEDGQGGRAEDNMRRHQIDFDIAPIRALVVTHVHIDHIGRLPWLLAAGYEGPIYCSEPSAELLPLMIEDALRVGFTRDRALIERFLSRIGGQLRALPYRQWTTLVDDEHTHLRLRLQRAGHILGSAYVELDTLNKHSRTRDRTLFSGDLGAPHAPLLPAPKSPWYADTVVIESTYGNRRHEGRRSRRERLRAVLESALRNGGTVMIPAFSIGRTQELLYEFEGLIHQGARRRNSPVDWRRLQIIVDSPLAARFNEVYRRLKPFWDAEAMSRVRAGRHPLSFDNLLTINDHDAHERCVRYLADTGQPAVVIAASGMAAGGRIVNYIRALISDPRHCLLFVGYQAPGTLGEQLQRMGRHPRNNKISIDGEALLVRAQIETIGGYSAHADQQDLLNFLRRMRHWPRRIRIVHGEGSVQREFAAKIRELAPAATQIECAVDQR